MKKCFFIFGLLRSAFCFCQESLFREGDIFPNYILRPVVNSPGGELDIHRIKGKYIILNFWGTWCAPCIPEMDSLAKLQNQFGSKIQVAAISNDDPARLKKYLVQRPTKVLLASDTSLFLYRNIGFNYVGQSIILNPAKQIIALVKTDSINTHFIQRLILGKTIKSSAELHVAETGAARTVDPFGVDSTTGSSVSLRSYMPDQGTMSLSYGGAHPMRGRRLTYFNTCLMVLFKEAYDIISPEQIKYEIDEKSVCNFDDKSTLVCFDLVVRADQKDSVRILMRAVLNDLLPFKARIEHKTIPVLLLKRNDAELLIRKSDEVDSIYAFSGKGFNGKALHISTFAKYLTNELRLPVLDETGLADRYDIKTENAFRTKEEVEKAIGKIGFRVERAERSMPVLIIY
jgi:uncharacterized protein (TIGR03435 family)